MNKNEPTPTTRSEKDERSERFVGAVEIQYKLHVALAR